MFIQEMLTFAESELFTFERGRDSEMSNFRVRVIILLSWDLGLLGHVRFFQICHAFVLSRGNVPTTPRCCYWDET
jgi:hypothetical protein